MEKIWLIIKENGFVAFSSTSLFLFALVLRRYSRPHIGYHHYPQPEDRKIHRYLFKSFEPLDVVDSFRIRVQADGGLSKVEVFAGPWLAESGVTVVDSGVDINLNGFPAEGVVALAIETVRSEVKVRVSVGDGSLVNPRGFASIPPWTPLVAVGSLATRWLMGLLASAVVFVLGVQFFFKNGFSRETDVWFGVFLLAASIFVLSLIIPAYGKETIQGYLGWNDAAYVWKASEELH